MDYHGESMFDHVEDGGYGENPPRVNNLYMQETFFDDSFIEFEETDDE